tara:strand:- start:9447 stop:9557 length:111 start_codon:yes stop_codon:yes gene_type:complete
VKKVCVTDNFSKEFLGSGGILVAFIHPITNIVKAKG